ncbi:hypothetical protein COCC4DRAFT_153447 [Bipolaris maydis ATCC 48331]|uniref:Uncharacterized protein n=2 Tax=Cochliobolus heterostrophus TaxID=5016 RepID=M2TTP1_COCH5|nr:uncharacterized protein COCC4DRAFT_153447 [Bipolaris maydis ATCC 48331]EMD85146.1 hypothetical protein COCHEDRAFT_1119697 [Bipolaris maydis C5]ENH99395.1 hypothetical protein COCC4DRAFT_153447 [Bipolaris maydis ATCC 48331]KAJ6209324.1 hypothetical protein PSV09DRAFT_1119697 [Bipolaris maydis]
MKIPIRASAAMAPITTPAMRPAEVSESELDGDSEAALRVDEEVNSPMFVIVMDPFSSPTALVAVTLTAILVGSTGVGKAFTTPPATLSITAVGTVTPLLDKIDDTSPTILDKKSPICRFRRACSFWTLSRTTLPAARHVLWACPSVTVRSAWSHGPGA